MVSLVARRKRERKRQVKFYGHGNMRWFGGILYFVDQNRHPIRTVTRAKEIPGDNKTAKGLDGAFADQSTRSFSSPRDRFSHRPSSADNSSFLFQNRPLRRSFSAEHSRSDREPNQIRYYDLPETLDNADGECCKCYHCCNKSQRVETVDAGRQKIFVCSDCGTKMRPIESMW